MKFAKKIEWEEKDTFCTGFDEMGPDWKDNIYKAKAKKDVVEWFYKSNGLDKEDIKLEEEGQVTNLIGYGMPVEMKIVKSRKNLASEVYPGLRS